MKPNYFEARDQLMKYRVRILLKKKNLIEKTSAR